MDTNCSVRTSRCGGFSCGGVQALERLGFSSGGPWSRQLWNMGSVALRHEGSFQARD